MFKSRPSVEQALYSSRSWFIVHGAPERSKFIECARNVNNTKPHWVINKIF